MKTKNELDQRVGERLRSRRLKMGLSQSELGAAAGVTFQQVQKYERGANRISAGRMIQFAEKLGVTPAYFVEGFGGGSKANGHAIKTARAIESVAASNEGLAVLQAMAQMKPARRKFMVTLARALRDTEWRTGKGGSLLCRQARHVDFLNPRFQRGLFWRSSV